MKKRKLSYVIITMVLIFGLFQNTAMAYTPGAPGLWIEGVMYATDTDIKGYYNPTNKSFIKNSLSLLNNQSNKTVTVNIPKNATYVMFRFWDYGNPNGISYPNNGFITGGAISYRINGEIAKSVYGAGTEAQMTSNNKVCAFKEFITYSADKFSKVDGETFTINAVRTVKGVRKDYTITYNINWVDAVAVNEMPANEDNLPQTLIDAGYKYYKNGEKEITTITYEDGTQYSYIAE